MNEDKQNEILELIRTKSVLKQNIFDLTTNRFALLKETLKRLAETWKNEISESDPRLEIAFVDLGKYHCQLTIAGDVLLFYMHSNVFRFSADSMYWNSGYLKEDPNRGYCGIIQVYNFLADSFRYRRENDIGYMIARMFINHENHFFVEGKKELGYIFNDFVNSELTDECMQKILLSVIKYCMEFDLYSPRYATVQQISVRDATSLQDIVSLKTGKRLGFQFSSPDNDIEA